MQATAQEWQLRTRSMKFQRLPSLMGILNVTPDSFSDGGHFFSVQSAVDRALAMEDEGADILDIGGESTRPYSEAVGLDEEKRRVLPVIEKLISRLAIPISVDTTKAEVAAGAISLGAEIINDISGLEFDPAMVDLARTTQVGVCAMHIQGTPQTMQDDPQYVDVVNEIEKYLEQRKAQLLSAGIESRRICLDPGIGFGKTHAHNLELLREVSRFHQLGCPILVGHSRKGFIAKVIGSKSMDRIFGTIGVTLALARQQVQVIRIHDVAAAKQALLLFEAAGGLGEIAI
jgi:dihydropteroate synthase